jgi:DNA-binding GntR family transcriptional regulator
MKSPQTTVSRIANHLRHEITYSILKPGHHIKETDIAKKFQVSRVPVREAFRILQSEGYLKMIYNRGSFVRKISKDYVTQTSAVYKLLAPVVLEKAIPRYTKTTYKKADAILKKIENCEDFSKTGYLLWDFAKIIYGPSKMKFVLSIFDEIYQHSNRVINELFMNEPQSNIKFTGNKKFIELCKKNKKDRAIKYWSEFVGEMIDKVK